MSWREGEIETGYVMERGRDRDWLCHREKERQRQVMSWREGEIETGFVMERGRDRDWLCHGERER